MAAVLTGFKEWRLAHPRATLSAMAAALDGRPAVMRARLVEDAALTSAAADLAALSPEARPRSPGCGGAMGLRGPETRHLTTAYEQPIALHRPYAACAGCRAR